MICQSISSLLTPAHGAGLNAEELKQALVDDVIENAAKLRDLVITKFMERTTPTPQEDVVAVNCLLFPKNPKNS